MFTLIRWPLVALSVWGAGWVLYGFLSQTVPPWVAMLLTTGLGLLASGLAKRRGFSMARSVALALGFPVSLWFLGNTSMPAWVWLMPLVLVVWIYPLRAWQDAPVFPTPLHALKDLPRWAPLPPQAHILDAGCGAGDGLLAPPSRPVFYLGHQPERRSGVSQAGRLGDGNRPVILISPHPLAPLSARL